MTTKVHKLKINNLNLDMDNQNLEIHNQVIRTYILPLSTKMHKPRIKNPNLYMVHQKLTGHAPLETKLKKMGPPKSKCCCKMEFEEGMQVHKLTWKHEFQKW
jgi:hypothetical protein